MVERAEPINLDQRRQVFGQETAKDNSQSAAITQFPSRETEVVKARERWLQEIPHDRLDALHLMVLNHGASGAEIVAGLSPDKNGKPYSTAIARSVLKGADRDLKRRAAEGLLTGDEIIVFGRLDALRNVLGLTDAEFKNYIDHRLLGKEMPRKETVIEPRESVLQEIEAEVKNHPREEKIKVSLPEVKRPAPQNRQDRWMGYYERVLKLYDDALWVNGLSWEEVIAKAKVRQRAKSAIARIENRLEKELAYDEDWLKALKEELHDLTLRDETDGFEPQNQEFYQRRLQESRPLAVKERAKPRFEELRKGHRETPLRVLINNNNHEVIIGDRIVVFESEAQWLIFSYLARRNGQQIPVVKIVEIAKKAGGDIQEGPFMMEDLKRQIGDEEDNQIIETKGQEQEATYSFAIKRVDHFREPRVEMKTQQVVSVKPQYEIPEAVQAKLKLEKKDPNYKTRLLEIAKEIANNPELPDRVKLFQIPRVFPSLNLRNIEMMRDKGIITPKLGLDGNHPEFTKEEIGLMLYYWERRQRGRTLTNRQAAGVGSIFESLYSIMKNSEPDLVEKELEKYLQNL